MQACWRRESNAACGAALRLHRVAGGSHSTVVGHQFQRNCGDVRNVVISDVRAAAAADADSLTAQLWRTTMPTSFKSTLVLTSALAIALTGLDLRPASARPRRRWQYRMAARS